MTQNILPRRAFLGAELGSDEEAFRPEGMIVAGVAAGGTAERAGLAAGDRVVSVAGMPVRDPGELNDALRVAGKRDELAMVFVRGTELRTINVPAVPVPLETGIDYGELAVTGGTLRTLVGRVPDPVACVYAIQGIACESIDHPEAPLAVLAAGWAEAGFDTIRVDKRGVGDSDGGPCKSVDFDTELADTRAAFAFAAAHARERHMPLVVFGHSVGAILASLVARDAGVEAIVVYGAPVMRWLACLRDGVRRQLALRGAPEDAIAAELARIDDLAQLGELNGRSAAYHTQLDRLDPADAWRAITAPVLVVRGEHDWVVAADDQARIAELAPKATVIDLPHYDHLCGWHEDRAASLRDYGAGRNDPALATTTAAWIRGAVTRVA